MNFVQSVTRGVLLASALALALPAAAGAISGKLWQPGNKPLGAVAVKLTCGGSQSAGVADAHGNYSLSIAASGLCTLTVGDGKTASVLLGRDPARYDFEVPASGTSLLQH